MMMMHAVTDRLPIRFYARALSLVGCPMRRAAASNGSMTKPRTIE